MSDKLLEVKGLKKIYHEKNGEIVALEDVEFSVYDKEFITIVGPSGCGKSTVLSVLSNIIDKSEGDINFNRKNPKIGYMLQKDSLFDWLTVLDNCLLGLKIRKELNDKSKERVIKLLNNYGLKDFKYKHPNSLSGGMRQRVALIRTLAINPDILLLDEPFSALDYQTRLTLSDDVYQIIKKEEKTVIMVTHDISEAVSMSDKVIVLTNRPCFVKNIYSINFDNRNLPTINRKNKDFFKYYDLIWKDLDHHV